MALSSRRTRLLIVDDHRAFAEALAAVLANEYCIVDVLSHGKRVLSTLAAVQVDALLLDTTLPECDVREIIRQIRRRHAPIVVVVMSIHLAGGDWPNLRRAGAHGVVAKSTSLQEFRGSLAGILQGPAPVANPDSEHFRLACTPRQIEVVRAMARGLSRQEIAKELHLSGARVDEHFAEMKRRLGVHTSAALVLRAVEEGWIEPRLVPPDAPREAE